MDCDWFLIAMRQIPEEVKRTPLIINQNCDRFLNKVEAISKTETEYELMQQVFNVYFISQIYRLG